MTSEQIYQFLPPNLRSFFLIESSLTSNASPVQQSIQAFAEAVRLLFSVASPTKVVTVVFAGREVTIEISAAEFTHKLIPPTFHLTLNHHTIYLDVVSAIQYNYEEQVACYLEELVHAFMNTSDEMLTHKIVELLYPKVTFNGITFQKLVNDLP